MVKFGKYNLVQAYIAWMKGLAVNGLHARLFGDVTGVE